MKQSTLRQCVIVFLGVLLAGCSSVQLAYNNAPALLQYQLDSYLDLDDQQEELLAQQLKQFQQWHRSSELPQYAQLLRAWAKKLDQPHQFTADELLQKHRQLEAALLVSAERAAFRLAPLVLTLTPRQRERLRNEFTESNAKYTEDYLQDPIKARETRLERSEDSYSDWFGSLTEQQVKILQSWLRNEPSRAAIWLQERMTRQKTFMTILEQARDFPSAEVAAQSLHDYFQSLSRYRVAQLKPELDVRLRSLAQLTAELLNSLTAQQRRHLQERLLDYASDFEALSK
jgi:hypothetical protein